MWSVQNTKNEKSARRVKQGGTSGKERGKGRGETPGISVGGGKAGNSMVQGLGSNSKTMEKKGGGRGTPWATLRGKQHRVKGGRGGAGNRKKRILRGGKEPEELRPYEGGGGGRKKSRTGGGGGGCTHCQKKTLLANVSAQGGKSSGAWGC